MKVAYITANAPWGSGETFLLEEMNQMIKNGIDLLIIPRNPPKEIYHDAGYALAQESLWLPGIDLKMIVYFFFKLILSIKLWQLLIKIVKESRSVVIVLKNLAVLPKAVYLTRYIKDIDHIHVHWGSTTATIGYILSELTDIAWSMTLHRWDITEDNMLAEKTKSTQFVRCISNAGKVELLRIISPKDHNKVHVIHMGVSIQPELDPKTDFDKFIFACPANMLEVKGEKYLIDACNILINKGIRDFICLLIGDGPLELDLKNQVTNSGLEHEVRFLGRLPHNELMDMYERRLIHSVVLPSINTDNGEHEGIPVALMEAMSWSIPVISTTTGGIPELLENNAGVLVPEKDPLAIANAMVKLMTDQEYRTNLTKSGYKHVYNFFNVEVIAHQLINFISLEENC